MRRLSALLAITALVAAPVTVFAAEPFAAELTADVEVPAPTCDGGCEGSGSASVTISDDESSIEYEVSFEGLTGPPVGAHIHFGATGEAGPVILPLDHASNPMTGTLTDADFVVADGAPQTFAEALQAMRDGDTYINVHTEANAPGEIRGQLQLIPDTSLAQPGGSSTGAPLGLLLLAIAGAAFLITYRRLAVRAV